MTPETNRKEKRVNSSSNAGRPNARNFIIPIPPSTITAKRRIMDSFLPGHN